MLDLLHLPKPVTGNADYFYGKSSSIGGIWETWEKPRGINMIRVTCIGAGGGGGGGVTDNNTGARGGGAGGGSGGVTMITVPAVILPDVLYVSVGRGGAPGATAADGVNASAGTAGLGSYVSIVPYTSFAAAQGIYTVCYALGGSGGGGGTTGGTATGGAAGGQAALTQSFLGGYGNFLALAGQAGSNGGPAAGGVGVNITYPVTGLLLSGGSGGGGGTSAGGTVSTVNADLFPQRTTGQDGIELSNLLLSTGGAGGTAAGAGSRGGHGGFGSGGGGGGAGDPGFSGGKGGNGLVVIHYW